MNWGNGIAVFFGLFVLFMVSLVVVCMKQDDLHLVTLNYYEEEIKYQEQIDKMANTNGLGYEVMAFDGTSKKVNLFLPTGTRGTLHLFRPSDARLDQKIAIEIHDNQEYAIDLAALKAGYWKMMLSWSEGGKSYYKEQKINL